MLLSDRSQRPALLPPLPPVQMPLPPIPPVQPSVNVQDLRNLQGPPLPPPPAGSPQLYQQLPGPTPQMLNTPMPRDAGYYDINRLMDALAAQFARRTMTPQHQFPELNMAPPTSPQNPNTGLPVIPSMGIRG
jgi:hypothetical protein